MGLALVGAAATGCEASGGLGDEMGEAGALTQAARVLPAAADIESAEIGREVSVPRHLQNGEEFAVSLGDLLAHGALLFDAKWTVQEGAGRPFTNGVGGALADPSSPLVFPRNFNRISAPDANACSGCHNLPVLGGGGDIVANVFVLGQRFDHVTFDHADMTILRGAYDERGEPVTLDTVANNRATLSMNGSGYIELLAREMSVDLQAIRDALAPGQSAALRSKGVDFGTLVRNPDGTWDTGAVEGLPAPSLRSAGAGAPPSLIIRPFHQAGAVVSLREFSNNAYNHHHGMQPSERFGVGVDADGDGFVNELTRADITAVSVWQATMAVPGRVIPNDPAIEDAVLVGEEVFATIGCTECHMPALPLEVPVFTEPNPFNPPGNLQPGDAPTFAVELDDRDLPKPRLEAERDGVVWVPAFTDLKLHDITSGPDDPNREPLDQNQPAGSAAFFAGNSHFLTRKLWGVANEPPFFHHGKFTTLREAVLAHAGEAAASTQAFVALSDYDQGAVIEFLKTLQILPAGSKNLVVDENGKKKHWPPRGNR
ncbi:di-heme oxidoredictase family protein [Haliangium ochraceum]|uniref:di-heme oxidoredictase family protein n=1 Tax=Haliangium ochraceum TaxID=80816 RepID=UPI00019B9B34|nr:di-heme oxidoredictase family protein [Haliangium ochraceum]